MKKAQHILSLALVGMLLTCSSLQSSFAGKSRIIEPNLSSLSFSANSPHKIFASVHSRRFDHQAINIGWGKRGKKIIQMRLTPGICREDVLSIPVLTINNPIPKDPNYSLLHFSCFSQRGPPALAILS